MEWISMDKSPQGLFPVLYWNHNAKILPIVKTKAGLVSDSKVVIKYETKKNNKEHELIIGVIK